MNHNFYFYILAMASITFLIRAVPIVLLHREIKNGFLRSFLHYMPYVTLSLMTVPAVFGTTGDGFSSAVGFVTAVVLIWFRLDLVRVSLISCGAALTTSYLWIWIH